MIFNYYIYVTIIDIIYYLVYIINMGLVNDLKEIKRGLNLQEQEQRILSFLDNYGLYNNLNKKAFVNKWIKEGYPDKIVIKKEYVVFDEDVTLFLK